MEKVTYISFGCSCQPAYQIRRITHNEKAYFFDWLITPLKSISKILHDFDSNLFLNFNQSGGMPVVDQGLRVLDSHTGLKFQHEFSTGLDGKINGINISEETHSIKKKYLFLRSRMIELMDDKQNLVYIRFEWPFENTALTENKIMENFIAQVGCNTQRNNLFVLASESVAFTRFEKNKFFFKLSPYIGSEQYKWHGNDQAWDELFSMTENYYTESKEHNRFIE